jgi:hypothetical protein
MDCRPHSAIRLFSSLTLIAPNLEVSGNSSRPVSMARLARLSGSLLNFVGFTCVHRVHTSQKHATYKTLRDACTVHHPSTSRLPRHPSHLPPRNISPLPCHIHTCLFTQPSSLSSCTPPTPHPSVASSSPTHPKLRNASPTHKFHWAGLVSFLLYKQRFHNHDQAEDLMP